jgi:hypothetical protein
MTQYLLSVWHDDDYELNFEGADAQRMVAQVDQFNRDLEAAGAWVFAGGLHPASSATVVRAGDAGVTMTDGPFAESKEQMGGFWVIEVPDLGGPWCARLRRPGRGAPLPGRVNGSAVVVDRGLLGEIYPS